MTFQGSLEELHLPDVIQLISVSGKSGAFKLTNGEEEGIIYLDNGQIVHSVVGAFEGEEAVYTLATWNHGTFKFVPGEESPARTITKNNTNLLMEAARRMDEWRVLSKRVPSLDHIPRFQVPEGKRGQINLNTQEWLVLSRINGEASISEIAAAVNMTAFDVAKLLYGLITMGLILMDPPGSAGEGSVEAASIDSSHGKAPDVAAPEKTDELLDQLDEAPLPAETELGDRGLQSGLDNHMSEEDLVQELQSLLRKLREVAHETIGDTAWPVIFRAYRQAKSELEQGKGTEAIQSMCRSVLEKAEQMAGPDTQRRLAERFQEVLSTWNNA